METTLDNFSRHQEILAIAQLRGEIPVKAAFDDTRILWQFKDGFEIIEAPGDPIHESDIDFEDVKAALLKKA